MEDFEKPIIMVVPSAISDCGATSRNVQMLSYEDFNLAIRAFEAVPDVEMDTRGTQVDSTAAGELEYNRDQSIQAEPQIQHQFSQTETVVTRETACDAMNSSMEEISEGAGPRSLLTGADEKETKMDTSESEPSKRQAIEPEQQRLNEQPNPKRKSQLHFLKYHLCHLKNLFKSISHDHPSNIFSFTEKYLDYVISLSVSLVTKSMAEVADQDRLAMAMFKEDPLWSISIRRRDCRSRSRSESQDTCSGEGMQGSGDRSCKRPKGIAAPNVRLKEDDRRSSATRRRVEYLNKQSLRSSAGEDVEDASYTSVLARSAAEWDTQVQRRPEHVRADPRLVARGYGNAGRRSSHEQGQENGRRRSPPTRSDSLYLRSSRNLDGSDRPLDRRRTEQARVNYRNQTVEAGEHSRGFRNQNIVQPQRSERPDNGSKPVGGVVSPRFGAQNSRMTCNHQNSVNHSPRRPLRPDILAEPRISPGNEQFHRAERTVECSDFLCLSSVGGDENELPKTPPPTGVEVARPDPSTPVRDEGRTSQEDRPGRDQRERIRGPNSPYHDEGCYIFTDPDMIPIIREDPSEQFPFEMPPREQHLVPTSHDRYFPPEIRHRGRRSDFRARFPPRRRRKFHQNANDR